MGAIVFPGASFGQLISIAKTSGNTYTVEAQARASDPQALQSSANLHLWVDLKEIVQDVPFSYSFDVTNFSFPARFFRLKPSSPPAEPIIMMMLGDSMASECCGWGRSVPLFLKENVTWVNYAIPNYSTKIFLQSAEWDNMRLIKPNYVLIQYGWIDGAEDPTRGTTLAEFATNLRTIINATRGWNGIPILITLHAARLFDEQGKLIRTIPQYQRGTMIEVANELNVPLIDLWALSANLFDTLGPAGCQFMLYDPTHPEDVMHFSYTGSPWVAQVVVNQLPDSLAPYLTGIFEPQPRP
jgi:lysophospholipase L1-like esterase